MSDNKTCKNCELEKAESDFPKGKGVCKACIANKVKETKAKKEESPSKDETPKTKTTSPTKKEEEKPNGNSKAWLTKKSKLNAEFNELMENIKQGNDDPEVKKQVIKFINHLTNFTMN